VTTNEDLIFVELALKRELLTPEQVDEILDLQKKLAEMGLTEPVASLAAKRGMLSEKDANALLVRISPKGGRQQIEGYRLVERLGRGGMGSVYKAIQISMGRPVAIKVLKPSLTRNDQQTERLRREAQLVGKLRHPNIVQGLDFGVSNGFHYFTMEYVEGESVREIIEARGPMKEKEATRIVHEVAKALDHAHREGVVHRDVKPGNILVAKSGTVLLADYGLAKGPLEDVELTQSGVTVGTPQYISPEQARGPSDVDIRTDLYSLGATLYHMVTGRPPYEGETLAHMIQQVLYESYAPPLTLRKDLSPNLAFLIEKLMARKPRHRYQNPRELLKDLEAIERGRSIVPAGWHGDFESFHKKRKLHRLVAAFVLLAFVLGLASGGAYWWNQKQSRKAREAEAGTALTSLLSLEVPPEGLEGRVKAFEHIVREWPGTAAARRVKEDFLPLYRRRLAVMKQLVAVRQRSSEKVQEGRFADAREEYQRFLHDAKQTPRQIAGPVVDLATADLEDLTRRRNEAVVRKSREKLEKDLYHRPPPDALKELRRYQRELGARMYTADEQRTDLVRELGELGDRLEQAIGGVGKYVEPVRKLVEEPAPAKDYRAVEEKLVTRGKAFEDDVPLHNLIGSLPLPWQDALKHPFTPLQDELARQNRIEQRQAVGTAAALVESAAYQQAIQDLNELAGRSIEDVRADLDDKRSRYEKSLAALKEQADQYFADFMPEFIQDLGRRKWELARRLLEDAQKVATSYQPSDFATFLEGARMLLDMASGWEGTFAKNVQAVNGQLPDGLVIDGVRIAPLFNVQVGGGTVSYRTRAGTGGSIALADVSVDDLIRYSGMDPHEEHVAFIRAVLRFGALWFDFAGSRPGASNALFNAIRDSLLEAVSNGQSLADPGVGLFARKLLDNVRAQRDAAYQQMQRFEGIAEDKWLLATDLQKQRRYQEAYDVLTALLEDPNFRETSLVRKNRAQIESDLEDVKKKLPSAGIQDYYRTRTTHLAGASVSSRDFCERIFFDFENPMQLGRFDFEKGRIRIVEATRPVLGPPPPDQPLDTPRARTEHMLSFLPPGPEKPDDWPVHHPLSLESPFLYMKPMAIDFRYRSHMPLALLLSLCGTNAIILTDDGRKVSGRGVMIWQGEDVEDPSRLVPEDHRHSFIADHPDLLNGPARHREYFQLEPDRWYHIRFERREKQARLVVDGIEVLSADIEQYAGKSGRIVIRTWTPADLDEIEIEGCVDPEWYQRRIVRERLR
jgi:serine/threonine-protein kinase